MEIVILLGEDGGVELVARTSKYILVFVFDYLSTQLYSYLYLALLLLLIHTCCFDPKELLKHLNSYQRGILRRSFRVFHREFDFTL